MMLLFCLYHCKKIGEVRGILTNGKKSSVSLVSSFDPYISFIALSANVSHNLYITCFSYPLAGLTIPIQNLGGIPKRKTPSIKALITFKCIKQMNSSLKAKQHLEANEFYQLGDQIMNKRYLLLFIAGLESSFLLQIFLILLVIVDELSEDITLLSSSLQVIINFACDYYDSVELVSFFVFNSEVFQ